MYTHSVEHGGCQTDGGLVDKPLQYFSPPKVPSWSARVRGVRRAIQTLHTYIAKESSIVIKGRSIYGPDRVVLSFILERKGGSCTRMKASESMGRTFVRPRARHTTERDVMRAATCDTYRPIRVSHTSGNELIPQVTRPRHLTLVPG